MNILVTGASGFAGSYLVEELALEPNNSIFATTMESRNSGSNNLKWQVCDLLDKEAVNKLIDGVKPEQIYHLAAYSSPGDSFKEPARAINDTALIQINLFEACLAAGITPRVLLVSSGQIYGKSAKLPIDEEAPIDCGSPYAVAKLCQENLADYYSKRGFEIVISRPFNHIGPRQRLGFLVADLAHQIAVAEKQGSAKVIKVGDLSSKRDFTDVRDIVRAYSALMEKGIPGENYNVCSGSSISGQAILDLLISMAKTKFEVELDPTKMRPADISDLYGDHSKLTSATGWEPKIKLEQTLSDTLEYWRRQD